MQSLPEDREISLKSNQKKSLKIALTPFVKTPFGDCRHWNNSKTETTFEDLVQQEAVAGNLTGAFLKQHYMMGGGMDTFFANLSRLELF